MKVQSLLRNKRIKTILTVISAFCLLAVFVNLVVKNQAFIARSFKEARYFYLFYAFLTYSLILPITAYVWHLITQELGLSASWKKNLLIFCISALGKRLPGTVWYIAWRNALYADKEKGASFQVVASVLEQISVVIAAIALSGFFSTQIISRIPHALIAYIFLFLLVLVFFIPNVQEWIFAKIGMANYRLKFSKIFRWALCYLPVWILNGLMLFFIVNVFYTISIHHLPYFIGIVCLTGVISRMLLILPSNFGAGEVSLTILLAGMIPVGLGAVIAVANRLIMITFELTWASLLFLFFGRRMLSETLEK